MIYDVIIIGAGAAGLMTAITASKSNLSVLLLEGQKKVGAKILMSGGTRCNVTNKIVSQKDYNSEHLMRVRNILRAFDNTDTIRFFESLGVELVLEPTGKYFPITNSGKTVLDALLAELKHSGVVLKTEYKVLSVVKEPYAFVVQGEGFKFHAHNIVLTTGGLSYPTTGSDGAGYKIAESFEHHRTETFPALTPLTTGDSDWKSLSGITIEAELSIMTEGKKNFSTRDGFLFTHLGFSGPTALDISRHWVKGKGRHAIHINFIPDFKEESFLVYLVKEQNKHPRKCLKNVLMDFLPERLVDVILKKAKLAVDLPMNQLSKEARRRLVIGLVQYPLACTGVVGYSKAEVTAGGVDFKDINPKNLESTLCPGVFFAGEILDVDGRIGGFNFQWAWASGYVVGQALIKKGKVS